MPSLHPFKIDIDFKLNSTIYIYKKNEQNEIIKKENTHVLEVRI